MSDEKQKDKSENLEDEKEDLKADETSGLGTEETDGPAHIAEEDFTKIQDDLDKAQAEVDGYRDDLQRLKAEFDNFRKRMLKEQSDFLKLAAQEVIGTLLPILDNFERALTHEIHGDQLDEYRNGMQLVYGQLCEALAKEGLVSMEPVGEPFDPTKHEAMMKMESDEYPEGTVIKVLEKGYILRDRVIRPAKVMVAG